MIIDGLGIITAGDRNSSGGTVMAGTNLHLVQGLGAARTDDLVDCPARYPDGKPHGINRIIGTASRYLIHGRRAAVHGDRSECGCTLISKFHSGIRTPDTSYVGAGSSSYAVKNTDSKKTGSDDDLEQYFEFFDETGSPINMNYRIDSSKEKIFEGLLDLDGKTIAFPISKLIQITAWKDMP